ncbi:MAG: Outer rane lipoproteinsorting protein, partial [Verrucomicrobiota bacterium]
AIDSGAPVLIEAYDAKGKTVKEFKPSEVHKVDGQWRVEELEMNNWRTGARSTLRFLYDNP